jgi:hypothetical protein
MSIREEFETWYMSTPAALKSKLKRHDIDESKYQYGGIQFAFEAYEAAKPKWNDPSTKPKHMKNVLIKLKLVNGEAQCVGQYVPKFTVICDADECESDYHEEKDEYFCKEGWYEQQISWDDYAYIAIHNEVIEWMELPK